MSDKNWPDELNFMHLRRLDMLDGGTRSRDFLKTFAVPIEGDNLDRRMAKAVSRLQSEAIRVLKIN
jgi:hypothetical protein